MHASPVSDAVPEKNAVPVESIDHPNGRGLPVGPRPKVRARDTTL